MKNKFLLVFMIGFQIHLFSQNESFFVFDKHKSSISSAENLTTLHRIVYQFENKHIKSKYGEENYFAGKLAGILYRLLKANILHVTVDNLTFITQHEVYGHGYRLREFGFRGNSYSIRITGGFARSGNSGSRQLGMHEQIAIYSGGMEADAVLSNNLKYRWLHSGEINFRESSLFVRSFLDYTNYIIRTDSSDQRGDVSRYLKAVNAPYGLHEEIEYKLTLDDLKKRGLVNLLNTFYLSAVYTNLIYLYDGDESFKYPMINLGKVRWLPAVRFGLTPFGSEFMVENYFKAKKTITEVSVRIGDNKLDDFWGGGLKVSRVFGDNFQLNSSFDFWIQPAMELGGIETYYTEKGFGSRFIGEFHWFFKDTSTAGIYSQIGYKTTGFIEGEQLSRGLIFRIGLSLRDLGSVL